MKLKFDADGAERGASRAVLAALLITWSGCASPPKMNANAPIEKRSVFLGTSYEQGGQAIDQGDMIDKLENEPRAADELSGYSAFGVTSLILATAGGALVGWPIGQAIGGEEEPLWVLAGVGGGLIAVSIPFAIVASNKLDNAVDAHNQSVGQGAVPSSPTGARSTVEMCVVGADELDRPTF
jgi:hypothetical protein